MTLTQALERIAFLEDQVNTLNEIVDKLTKKKSKSKSDHFKDLRKHRRENGLCTVCGIPLPLGSTAVRRENCRSRANNYEAIYREKSKEYRRKGKTFFSEDMYSYEEASICLTCEAENCTGNCKRFKEAKNRLEVGDER